MREDFSSFSHCCVVDCLIANWNFVSIRLFFSFVKFSEKNSVMCVTAERKPFAKRRVLLYI